MSSNQVRILNDHNQYRARHGAQPLVLDANLNRSAQAFAQQLASQNGGLSHSSGNYGENLYYCEGLDPLAVTKEWYDEVSVYNFNSGGSSPATGHFTQIVWRATTSLGVGIAQSSSGRTYVVAHYYPPGNYAGQFRENVLPAGNHGTVKSRTVVAPAANPSSQNAQQFFKGELPGFPSMMNGNGNWSFSHQENWTSGGFEGLTRQMNADFDEMINNMRSLCE